MQYFRIRSRPNALLRYEEFIFPITIHPDVSGRPHALLMHERLIEHFKKHEGVEFVTMEQICDEFKGKNVPPQGAIMPAERGAMLKKSWDPLDS
jgi:hypothetical protein